MPPRLQRPYPPEFRREAIRLVRATGRRDQDVAPRAGNQRRAARLAARRRPAGGGDRVDEAGAGVRGDEPDAGEAAGDEAAQEGGRGGAVLGGDDVEPQRLAVAG